MQHMYSDIRYIYLIGNVNELLKQKLNLNKEEGKSISLARKFANFCLSTNNLK